MIDHDQMVENQSVNSMSRLSKRDARESGTEGGGGEEEEG